MIDASKFARPALAPATAQFGIIEAPDFARMLRTLADAAERGEVAIVTVQTGQVVKPDDFLTRGLFVEYVTISRACADV